MKKEKITKMEILEDYGYRFQTCKAGYVDKKAMKTNKDSDERLLPAGFSERPDGSVETPAERNRRLTVENQNQKTQSADDDMLLPIGIELED